MASRSPSSSRLMSPAPSTRYTRWMLGDSRRGGRARTNVDAPAAVWPVANTVGAGEGGGTAMPDSLVAQKVTGR